MRRREGIHWKAEGDNRPSCGSSGFILAHWCCWCPNVFISAQSVSLRMQPNPIAQLPPAKFKPFAFGGTPAGCCDSAMKPPTLVNPHLSRRPRKQRRRIATCSLPAWCEIALLSKAWAGQSHAGSTTRLEYLTVSLLKCFLLMQSDV